MSIACTELVILQLFCENYIVDLKTRDNQYIPILGFHSVTTIRADQGKIDSCSWLLHKSHFFLQSYQILARIDMLKFMVLLFND